MTELTEDSLGNNCFRDSDVFFVWLGKTTLNVFAQLVHIDSGSNKL